MDIKAEEISKIIRDQIGSYAVDVDVNEVGSIISIGDGIARVHGVENAMAGEMLEFPHDQGRRPGEAHRAHHLRPGR
jgi:F-type H+-transporting ATPase subunit alpha